LPLEILAINPRPKKTRKRKSAAAPAKKEVPKMARKRRRGSSSRGRGRSTVRVSHAAPRHNPEQNPPSRARRYYARARSAISTSGIGGTIKTTAQLLLGALIVKLAQKKIGSGKPETSTSWDMKDYAISAVAAFAAGFVAKSMFKSPQVGERITQGGLLMLGLQAVKEITERSDTLKEYLGADEPYTLGANEDEGSWAGYGIGDLFDDGAGNAYVLGADMQWHALTNAAQTAFKQLPAAVGYNASATPAVNGFGDIVQAPGPLGGFGDIVQAPGPLGGFGNMYEMQS